MALPKALPRALVTTGAVLAGLALSHATSRDLAPDAVSRATTWNEHSGEVAWLTDGLYPPEEASAYVWSGKGILVFEWGEVLPIRAVRLYVGEADADFQVKAYIGGARLEDGSARDPTGEQTARIVDQSGDLHQWVQIDLPEGTEADNLELVTSGAGAELYEVQVLTVDAGPTGVSPVSWARVKATPR